MKKILLTIFLGIFLVSLISAISICVDKDPPSTPSNLEVTISGQDIILTWYASTDIPNCSGIDYYNISRDGNWIGTTSFDILTYTDAGVPYGTYSYSVYAIDKIGHNSGLAIINDVVIIEVEGEKKVSGGGGGSSYVCYEKWQCIPWTECIDGVMVRTCTDLNKCGTTKEKPQTSSTCSLDEEGVLSMGEGPEKRFFTKMTGAVIGALGTGGTIGALVFVLGILGTVIFIKFRTIK